MPELETIREWYRLNAPARRGYLEVFARSPREEPSRGRGASDPTLLKILLHSLDAISCWVEKAAIDRANYPEIDHKPDPSLEEVRRFDGEVRAEAKRFLDGFPEGDLDRTFRIPRGGASPRDLLLSVRDMLWHLVEEEPQHRDELNALLWQLDVDPPILDWIDWVKLPERHRVEENTGQSHR
jgi:uncharacterized damage-inducible protein DinB